MLIGTYIIHSNKFQMNWGPNVTFESQTFKTLEYNLKQHLDDPEGEKYI